MRSTEVRKRPRGGKRVREGGALVQNSRIPKPAGLTRSARRAAMATGAKSSIPRYRRRWIVTEEGKKKKPPSPTVTVVVAASAGLGQSARRSPINRVAPTLLDEKMLVFLSLEFVGKLSISILPRAGDSSPAHWPSLEFQSRRTLVRARSSPSGISNSFVTVWLIAAEAVGPLKWEPCPSSICPAPMAQDESVFNGLRLDIAAFFFSSYCPRFVCGSEE